MRRGAIILCGGQSSRMGGDKGLLPFGNETMLQRVVRIVATVVNLSNVIVVAAKNQQLPELPSEVQILRDRENFQGPLAAVTKGLESLKSLDAAFVIGCDAPLLVPVFVEYLFDQLGDSEAVIPEDEHLHSLCAVYRTSVLNVFERHFAAGNRSLHRVVSSLEAARLPTAKLREVDPQLDSLRNVNSREDYLAAIQMAGIRTSVNTFPR
jgi:molybdopterin-guanine dinucleotide biosynthesis protein A